MIEPKDMTPEVARRMAEYCGSYHALGRRIGLEDAGTMSYQLAGYRFRRMSPKFVMDNWTGLCDLASEMESKGVKVFD